MVRMFSTNCPKCKVLDIKMSQKNIEHEINTDVDLMLSLGITAAPALQLDDGTILNFSDAIKWVNNYGN